MTRTFPSGRRVSKAAHYFNVFLVVVTMLLDTLLDKLSSIDSAKRPVRRVATAKLRDDMPNYRAFAFADVAIAIDDLANDRMDFQAEEALLPPRRLRSLAIPALIPREIPRGRRLHSNRDRLRGEFPKPSNLLDLEHSSRQLDGSFPCLKGMHFIPVARQFIDAVKIRSIAVNATESNLGDALTSAVNEAT